MKFLRLLFVGVILFTSSVSYAQLGKESGLWEFKKLAENPVQQSICVVDSGGGFGTGFVVGKRKILTAHHVIKGKHKVVISFPQAEGKPKFDACVYHVDPLNDLAVLVTFKELPKSAKVLRISKKKLQQGEKIQFLGFSGFILPRHFIGKVLDVEGGRVLHNSNVIQGDSGGPVLNSEGKVVSMVQIGMVDLDKYLVEVDGKSMLCRVLALTVGVDGETINKFLIEEPEKPYPNRGVIQEIQNKASSSPSKAPKGNTLSKPKKRVK